MNDAPRNAAFGPTWPQGCWPDETQQKLLSACLSRDPTTARQAFEDWSEMVPYFFVDAGSHKLMLVLYERLRDWGVDYHDMSRLKGLARYYWVKHQTLTRELHQLTQGMNEAGLTPMLLKGAALNATVYTTNARLMNDLDVAVPRRQADQAVALLERLGWTPRFRNLDRLTAVTHGCHFERGDQELDLHWDFFHGRPMDDLQQRAWWDAASSVSVGRATAQVLCPADQLLHTCEHGMRANVTPPFRWLADACQIVRAEPNLDWDRLVDAAERFQLIAPVEQTLRYLHERLETPIADEVFAALGRRRKTLASRIEHGIAIRRMPGAHPFWTELPAHLFDYARCRKAHPGLGFTDYLLAVNDLDAPFRRRLWAMVRMQAFACGRWLKEQACDAARRCLGRPPAVRISPFHDEPWNGFSAPERTKQGPCRWSMENSSVLLPIGRRPHRVVLRLAESRPWNGDLERNLWFRMNRSVVPPAHVRFDDWSVSFDVTSDMLADFPRQRLELRCTPWTSSPRDSRPLGAPIRDVTLIPLED